jgi:hypothetical protein
MKQDLGPWSVDQVHPRGVNRECLAMSKRIATFLWILSRVAGATFCWFLSNPALADTEVNELRRALAERTLMLESLQAKADDSVSILVNTGGTKADAIAYYSRIAKIINFDNLLASDLNGLLRYLGLEGLVAADLEVLLPSTLMPRDQNTFNELAAAVEDPSLFRARRKLADFTQDRVLVTFLCAEDRRLQSPAQSGSCPSKCVYGRVAQIGKDRAG